MWATPFVAFFGAPVGAVELTGAVVFAAFFVDAPARGAAVFEAVFEAGFDAAFRSKLEPNIFEKNPCFAGALAAVLLALEDFELLPAPDVDLVEPPEL